MSRAVVTRYEEDGSSLGLPRFLADGMLGGLVRWLRFLGYDTLYFQGASRDELVRLAKEENRVFLTRGHVLENHQASVLTIIVHSKNPWEQLKQVVAEMELDSVSYRFSRCSLCNVRVRQVKKERVERNVPRKVFTQHTVFWECPKCHRIYWEGGHWLRMKTKLEILGLSKIT